MSRFLKVSVVLIFGVLLLAVPASAQRGGFHGGGFHGPVIVAPGIGLGLGYGYGYGYGYYGPAWGYGYGPYAAYQSTGEVKIDTHRKDASVYIDGGYAGVTAKLKKFHLGPGNHDIEMRDPGGKTIFHERVRVIVGKTTDIAL